jgi:hypothetical protein
MQQSIMIFLTAIISALIIYEFSHSIRAMKYQQFQIQKRNNPFDIYAMDLEKETRKHLRQLYYHADMDSKYNE